MNRFDQVSSLISLIAALLMAGAPLLADSAPGSDRSIVVAVAGVLTAVVVLVRILAARGQTSSLVLEIQALRAQISTLTLDRHPLSDSGGRGTRTKNC
jgi:hypothetical protein